MSSTASRLCGVAAIFVVTMLVKWRPRSARGVLACYPMASSPDENLSSDEAIRSFMFLGKVES